MGKIIQNKKGQTTITIPKALVESMKLEKGMEYEFVINHHNEVILRIKRDIVDFAKNLEKTENKIVPIYFG